MHLQHLGHSLACTAQQWPSAQRTRKGVERGKERKVPWWAEHVQQIVHIDLEPFFSDHVSKDVIHKCLKSWWGIAKTKEYDSGFKEAKGSDECGLPLIFFPDADVVVSPLDIKLGKESGVLHIVNQFRDEW